MSLVSCFVPVFPTRHNSVNILYSVRVRPGVNTPTKISCKLGKVGRREEIVFVVFRAGGVSYRISQYLLLGQTLDSRCRLL